MRRIVRISTNDTMMIEGARRLRTANFTDVDLAFKPSARSRERRVGPAQSTQPDLAAASFARLQHGRDNILKAKRSPAIPFRPRVLRLSSKNRQMRSGSALQFPIRTRCN